MRHIILAIDSFKGCLSSAELGKAAAEGVRAVFPACQTTILPVADGGEGTVDALTQATGGEIVKATVHGPLGQPVEARYGIAADRRTAILEMASASGLALIPYNILAAQDPGQESSGCLLLFGRGKGLLPSDVCMLPEKGSVKRNIRLCFFNFLDRNITL